MVGNPCHIITGNKYQAEPDYVSQGLSALRFVRTYNSQATSTTALGTKWQSNYDRNIVFSGSNNEYANIPRADGRIVSYKRVNSSWQTSRNNSNIFKSLATGWSHTRGDVTDTFDASGRLISIAPLNGRSQTLSYNNGQLTQVRDDLGQTLDFSYNTDGTLASVIAPGHRTWHYRYDSIANLAFVDNPDGTTRQYHYENTNFPQALTGITDERNLRYATWGYDSDGKAAFSTHANNAGYVLINYKTNNTTNVINSANQTTTYRFTGQSGIWISHRHHRSRLYYLQ